MVRENRVKFAGWQGTQMTAPATNHIDVYTDSSVNGMLKAIQFKTGNYSGDGSVWLSVSGTGERIFQMISGTICHNIAADFQVFPQASCVNLSDSGLAATFTEVPLFGIIRLTMSGAGAGKSGGMFNFVYV